MPLITVEEKQEDHTYIMVPIVKATTKKADPNGEEQTGIEVDIEALPDDVYKEVLIQGLKVLMNRGMSKLTGEKDAKHVKTAVEIAQKNLEALYSGKIRMSAGVRTKTTGAQKTEAMRLARLLIKDQIKASGGKISHYSAKAITEAAKEFLDSELGAEVMTQAKANIEAREAEKEGLKDATKGILASLKPDPKLVKAAEEKNKKPRKDKIPAGVLTQAKPGTHATQH